MDSLKRVLHIRSKSKSKSEESALSDDQHAIHDARASFDDELAAMSESERAAYLAEFEDAERTGHPKKGSLLEKLIERGNRKTEEQFRKQAEERNRAAAGVANPVGTAGVGKV